MPRKPTKKELAHFSKRLRERMTETMMTVDRLSEETGISDRQIQRYRAGSFIPTYSALVLLADALDTTIEDLTDIAAPDLQQEVEALAKRVRRLERKLG